MTMIIAFVLMMLAGAITCAETQNFDALRQQMVDTQIRARDVRSEPVLQEVARLAAEWLEERSGGA